MTPHVKSGSSPDCHLSYDRHQIIGDALRVFPDQAAGMGTHWVEIPQQSEPPSGIAAVQIAQDLFNH